MLLSPLNNSLEYFKKNIGRLYFNTEYTVALCTLKRRV